MAESSTDAEEVVSHKPVTSRSRARSIAAPLLAAMICTILIVEATKTALNSRANGDIMEIACPLLGAIFLSIPAAQAWWATIKIIHSRSGN